MTVLLTLVIGCPSERAPLIDVPLYRLHGNLPQVERTETYFRFCKAEAGILFTTDVGMVHCGVLVVLGNR